MGRIDERLRWFAAHGVRECWLLHLIDVLEVVRFEEKRIAGRALFDATQRIDSAVLPDFERTLGGMLG